MFAAASAGAYCYWQYTVEMEEEREAAAARARLEEQRKPTIPYRDHTAESLLTCDGKEGRPLYICCKGVIFDVTHMGLEMYGADGPYSVFVGRDASRAFAKMSLEKEEVDNPDLSDLSAMEEETLNGWFMSFDSKYPVVGDLIASTA